MKYVRIKKLSKDEILSGYSIVSDKHPSFDELVSRAHGVDHIDKDPETGTRRVHLLDRSGFEVFGWIFEDLTEVI